MGGRICRIRWRPGEPLGLTISERTSFLDLPRELRDQIYYHCLVQSERTIIWSGFETTEDESISKTSTKYDKVVRREGFTSDNYNLRAFGLLRCNRQIAGEAASALYRWNTFYFRGGNVWVPLCAFLVMIGHTNRLYLQSIELESWTPEKYWQYPNGTRTTLGFWAFRQTLSPNRLLQREPILMREGEVDHIDPEMETCFRILGPDGPPLKLTVNLPINYLPGIHLLYDEQHPERGKFDMDIPLAMEIFRREYTTKAGSKSRVEILWDTECAKDRLTDHLPSVEKLGWEMLDVEESFDLNLRPPHTTWMFKLRMKEFSDGYIRRGMEVPSI